MFNQKRVNQKQISRYPLDEPPEGWLAIVSDTLLSFRTHSRLSPILSTWQAKVADLAKGFAIEAFACGSALSLIPWFVHGCDQGEESKTASYIGAVALLGLIYGTAHYQFYRARIEQQIKPATRYHDEYVNGDARFLVARECELWLDDEDTPVLSPDSYPIPVLSPSMKRVNLVFNLLGSLFRALAAVYWSMLVFYNQDNAKHYRNGCFHWPAYAYLGMIAAVVMALIKHCNFLTLFIEDVLRVDCERVWHEQLMKTPAGGEAIVYGDVHTPRYSDLRPSHARRLHFTDISMLDDSSRDSEIVGFSEGGEGSSLKSCLLFRPAMTANQSSFLSAWSEASIAELPPMTPAKQVLHDCVHGWGSLFCGERNDGALSQRKQAEVREHFSTPVKLGFS